MLVTACHCGAIRITVPRAPEYVIDCNCSLCRRNAGLWAFYDMGEVVVDAQPGDLASYVWGDRTIRNVRCATCGCATHWESISETAGTRCGVNLRNAEPADLAGIRVRRFDGADTWDFLD